MSIAKSAVKKPVTIIIIFIVLAVLGINASGNLPQELIPDMEIPYLMVSTTYPNASPEEVEDKIAKTLESALASVSGLKNISSTSSEGSCMVALEFEAGTNLADAANSARDRIDMIRDYLPTEASSPMIIQLDMTMLPVMVIALNSPAKSVDELKILADKTLSPLIEQIDGVASTTTMGGRERQIKVEISKDRLESYGLSFTQIAQLIAAQNMNTSVGSINENGIDYTIQTDGLFSSIEEIGETVISYKAGRDGKITEIKLGDIADIYDTYKEAGSYFALGENECVALTISKQSGKNTVEIANKILGKMDTFKKSLPEDCSIAVVYNSADMITQSIAEVLKSAVEGAVLAVLILLIFLREFKSTALIAISIPLSILVTLLVMYYSEFSLNLMTLAGLALGIGMLVDSSIVVIENIYTYRHRGVKPEVAAVLGTTEMVSALLSSTLTTCCVFIPMVLYKNRLGLLGSVFNQLSVTVIISLLSSLFVAVTLIPVLTSKFKKKAFGEKEKTPSLFMQKTDAFFEKMEEDYAKSVKWVLNHKLYFFGAIGILFIWACIQIPKVGFSYMPASASTSLNVTIEMPKGTDLETSKKKVFEIADVIRNKVSGIQMEATMVGSSLMSFGSSGSSNSSTLMYMFYPASSRQQGWDNAESAKEKIEQIKEKYPEASIEIEDSGSMASFASGSTGLDIEVASADRMASINTALKIEALLKDKGANLVKNVKTNIEEGLPKLDIVFDRQKMYSLGVNIATANAELKANIGGMLCARYRDNGQDVDIVLSLPEKDKQNQLDLEDIMVTSSFGSKVPLSSFATIVESRTSTAIVRENQSNIIHITADALDIASLTEVQTRVQNLINTNIPSEEGVSITFSGDYESMMEALGTFIEIIAVAIILVFGIMASQFESFRKPFIVLFTMPLALIGIVIIYKITGFTFTVITAVGALILVGIVVNNGIVLIDYTGLMQKRGLSVTDSCVVAARSRLRPILMTTLTTVLALVPMAFFPGEGGELIQPLGQTVFSGLMFSTLMTLYMMPTLYEVFYRRSEKRRSKNEEV